MARLRTRSLYHLVLSWFVCVLAAVSGAQAVIDVRGFVSAGVVQSDAPASWRSGEGFGLLDLGTAAADSESTEALGDAHLVLDASRLVGSRSTLGAFLHLTGRTGPSSIGGDDVGIVEAYLEAEWRLRKSDVLRVQLGHFLLPTSRENVSWAWSSPYTLTFSAINTWIGEEVRPTGLSLEYRAAVGDLDELRCGATAFGGNDSAGALLAWRGWAMGDRLTVWDEVAPLPPAPSIGPGGGFGRQRDDGTLPMSADLDGRVGYAGWLSWSRPERAQVQVSWYDNRADRGLWRSGNGFEYAWDTRFWHVAWEAQLSGLTLASEWIYGETGMGHSATRRVDTTFESIYLLASYLTQPRLGGTWRFSTRWDEFKTVDLDGIGSFLQDNNDSEGSAFTAAVFWEWQRRPLRVGLEYLHADATREQAGDAGFSPQVGGEQLRVELRYFFGG